MKYWETKEGQEIPYKKLADQHLYFILKWVERTAKKGMLIKEGGGSYPEDFWYDEYEIKGLEVEEKFDYRGLLAEAKKRKLSLKICPIIKIPASFKMKKNK